MRNVQWHTLGVCVGIVCAIGNQVACGASQEGAAAPSSADDAGGSVQVIQGDAGPPFAAPTPNEAGALVDGGSDDGGEDSSPPAL